MIVGYEYPAYGLAGSAGRKMAALGVNDAYSDRRLLTRSATAALTASKLTVNQAMNSAAAEAAKNTPGRLPDSEWCGYSSNGPFAFNPVFCRVNVRLIDKGNARFSEDWLSGRTILGIARMILIFALSLKL